MADTPEQEIVKAISVAGWLQGDTVSGETLIQHISKDVLDTQFEGKAPEYWVLASHSCTVHARNFADAPQVEWIAARIKKKAFDKHLNALNPRTLILELGEKQFLELKIHKRVWTSRAVLPTLTKNGQIDPSLEARSIFSYWLAHSYNRIAMPDALVERLTAEQGEDGLQGIARLVDEFLKTHNHKLASAWVSFYPKHELQDPEEPYEVIFRFLTKQQYAREVTDLDQELSHILGVPRGVGGGLEFKGAEVTVLQDFTMLDAEDYVRYNLHDWLSVGDSDDDLVGDEEVR